MGKATAVADLALVAARLPEGWTVEYYDPSRPSAVVILTGARRLGYVTIDFERRGFRIGASISGPPAKRGMYTGHGWRERLVDDAVAALTRGR